MSLTVTQRPNLANPVTSNTYYVLESDRALAVPFTRTSYRIDFPAGAPIASTVVLTFGDVEITAQSITAAYDPLDPNNADLDTPDITEARRRLANAINANEQLNSDITAFINFSGELIIESNSGQILAYTPTSGTPAVISFTLLDAGAVAGFRTGYRLVMEAFLPVITGTPFGDQEVFTAGTSLAIPSKLTNDTEALTDEEYEFRLQRILRALLNYDGYQQEANPQYLGQYAKAFFVRFREEFSGFQGKWLYDPTFPLVNPSDPYDADILPFLGSIFPQAANIYLAVNAEAYDYATLPEGSSSPVVGLCIQTDRDYPNALAPFFSDTPRSFLSTFDGKCSQHNAPELLAFFVAVQDGISLPTLTLRKEIQQSGGGVVTIDTPITNIAAPNAQCFSDITNAYVGRTIQLQAAQLWQDVDCNAQRVCYSVLALLPNDNEYTYGDDGTFENPPFEHEAVDFTPNAGCPSPEVLVDRTNTIAFQGDWSLFARIGCGWVDETFSIQATGDTTLSPNTEYELTAWVWVIPRGISGFGFGEQISIGVSGFTGSSLTIVDTFDYASDARGQWRQLRTILNTGSGTTGRIKILTGQTVTSDDTTVLYVDNIRVQQTSLETLVQPYAFELKNCCDQLVAFAFQNPLGVCETMHLEGVIERAWEFESEDAKAEQDYTVIPTERRELFKSQTQKTQLYQLRTRVQSYNLFKLEQLLSASHVDWITTDSEDSSKCSESETVERVVPIQITSDEIDFKRIRNGVLEFTLEFTLSRLTNRIQK